MKFYSPKWVLSELLKRHEELDQEFNELLEDHLHPAGYRPPTREEIASELERLEAKIRELYPVVEGGELKCPKGNENGENDASLARV